MKLSLRTVAIKAFAFKYFQNVSGLKDQVNQLLCTLLVSKLHFKLSNSEKISEKHVNVD